MKIHNINSHIKLGIFCVWALSCQQHQTKVFHHLHECHYQFENDGEDVIKGNNVIFLSCKIDQMYIRGMIYCNFVVKCSGLHNYMESRDKCVDVLMYDTVFAIGE